MATWQGVLIHAESVERERLREVAERYRIVVSIPSGPWLLIDVEPQLGRLGPPPFAREVSKDLNTAVIAFFLQTTVSAERIEHWVDGELVRELEYYQEGGGCSRAEALYVELSGSERELLGKAIAAFRAALQGQKRDFIDSMRDVLIARMLDLSRRD